MVNPVRSYHDLSYKKQLFWCFASRAACGRSYDMIIGNLSKNTGLIRATTQTFIAIAIILIQAGSVRAIHVELSPSLSWLLYYEDNIAGVSQNQPGKISGFSNRYRPEFKFVITSSKFSVSGETRLQVNRYLSEKDYDNTDRFYNINGSYTLNPRSMINLWASYTLTSNPERYLVTDEQGFQAGVLVRNTQDEIKSYGVNYDYELSPRNSLSLMFGYTVFSSAEFNNTSSIYLYSASFKRMLNKKDELSFSLGYNHFQYNYGILDAADLGFTMDSYSISTGIVHEFSDSFTLDSNIGWYIAETKQRQAVFEQNPDTGETIVTGTETINNSTPGSNFSFLLKKKYFHTDLQFRVSQALGTNPDNGQTYPSTNISISIGHDLTDKLRGTCYWAYFSNKSDAGDYNNRRDIDNSSYVGGLGLQYRFRRNIIFSIQYSRAESESSGAQNSVRNSVFLGCTVDLQRPFIVR